MCVLKHAITQGGGEVLGLVAPQVARDGLEGFCREASGLDEGGVQAACPRSLRLAAGPASRQFLRTGPEECAQSS